MLTTPEEPPTHSRTWSMAALAAEAALDAPRASMMAAPRFCTVGMKSFSTQAMPTRSSAGEPPTVAWCRSGYMVGEWLPQMARPEMSVTAAPVLAASCAKARLWSRRVMAVKLRGSSAGALCCAIRQLVFAGLPTTSTFASRLAWSFSALPCTEKIAAFASSRSLRSMPGPRGLEPTRSAMSVPSKATFGSSVATMPRSSGNAQSSISMTTPRRASMAGGISSSCSTTGRSAPSMAPEATRKTSA